MQPPLAIYIHWPFCKSKCPYCDFNSHVREQVDQARWRAALLKELEYMAAQTPGHTVKSIFFGGGTPSLMPPATAAALIERVHRLWPVAADIEITCEANPTSVEAATFADFKAAGVGRVSLGVQSLDDEELKFLGRGHSAHEALKAVEMAAKTFGRYSFDLIYARPGQTPAAWEKELSQAFRHAGKHLSLYQLTIEENTAFHHAYAQKKFSLPDEETSEALYRLTEDMTAARGIPAYEVSNYAVPGEESRHNLAYWQGGDYIGVGPGAHGRITLECSRYAPTGARMEPRSGLARSADRAFSTARSATVTLKSPERWLEAVERQGHGVELWEEIDRKRDSEERVMMGLRLKDGIGYDDFAAAAGYDLAPHINAGKRALYVREGLLEGREDYLQPTLKGRLVLTRLTAELLN